LKLSNRSPNPSDALLVKLKALRLLPYLLPGVCARAPVGIAPVGIASVGMATEQLSPLPDTANAAAGAGGGLGAADASPDECSNVLLAAVDDLVATHFPLKSHEQPLNSPQESAYRQLLSEALAVASRAGCLGLLGRLQGQLKEGPGHRYGGLLLRSLRHLAAGVDAGGDEPALLACLSFGLAAVGSDREPLPTRLALLEGLLLPLLRRAAPNSVLRVFTADGLLPFGRHFPSADHCLLDRALALLRGPPLALDASPDAAAEFYFSRALAMNLVEQVRFRVVGVGAMQ
jgi:hypothetical protein